MGIENGEELTMTSIYGDPAKFKEDVITGFAKAFPRYVERVPNASGFVRAGGPLDGKVSLVIGGGSGHYPSYNGVVGTGFADGCVLGDIFASPSTEQVYRICRAADGGAGVVLAFGNYAGDRLNFGLAADRLRADGLDVRVVWVTDDVASASPQEKEKRRGIAGTFTVYKMAGAAAERGDDLDEVERLMRKANEATYSFGVAFAGCTLPGASEPLFQVDPQMMDFGLGIHGEPGITSEPWMSAEQLAAVLVEKVLAERPADADGRAAVLVNGLGATKWEELFCLYGTVAERLEAVGVTILEPEVGEYVTSLDMAGCSLTVTWLDDELEALWLAPAETPAFNRGQATTAERGGARRSGVAEVGAVTQEEASAESIASAETVKLALAALSDAIENNKDELGRIDAIAGDGDHGIGMSRGGLAARAAGEASDGGVKTVLAAAGRAFGDRAGGTSGVLWGLLLEEIGKELGNQEELTAQRVADAIANAAVTLKSFSKAELGDKTMLDSLFPFVDTLSARVAAGDGLADAWEKAAQASTEAAQATAALVPKIGRARPLAERSVGTPDPGAVSLAMIAESIHRTIFG